MYITHLNCRSLCSNFVDFKTDLLANNYDICAIGETWLTPDISSNVIAIDGYTFVRRDRSRRGGGVGIYIKSDYNYNLLTSSNAIEQVWIQIKLNKRSIIIGVVYRPPSMEYKYFLDNVDTTITNMLQFADTIVCLGDFNIDLLQIGSAASEYLKNLLNAWSMSQIIEDPTRTNNISSTLIDLILINNEDLIQAKGAKSMHHVSDHDLIYVKLNFNKVKSENTFYSYRDYRNIIWEQFNADLMSLPLYHIVELNNIDDKILFFNECLLYILNLHCPIKTIKKKYIYNPWLTDNIKLLMSMRDRALKIFKTNRTNNSWQYYKDLRNFTNVAIKNEKKAYLQHKFQNSSMKDTWKELKKLNIINNKNKNDIPPHLQNVDDINKFFINAIPKSNNLNKNKLLQFYNSNTKNNLPNTFNFKQIDDDTVLKILNKITSNAEGSDMLSIRFIKLCCPYILPLITHLINFCIENGVFPSIWKEAIVYPLPKSREPVEFKDLRPISVLPALSKILEKHIEEQTRTYLDENRLLPALQSGFRSNHSCTTALLHISDDIISATDVDQATVLVLLDFSKAFDTLDYDILIAIFNYLGFSRISQTFLKNYLTDRRQVVKLKNTFSKPANITCGVPQGSNLGPLLFTIFTSNLQSEIKYCKYHFYADDTQIYLHFNKQNLLQAINNVNTDLENISQFSADHGLIINPNKSSALLFCKKTDRNYAADNINIFLNNNKIELVNEVKNLGLLLDSDLRFKSHITSCIRKAYCNLKLLYNNKDFLNTKLKTILCNSLVLSQFNYCDIIYGFCMDARDKSRIQVLQNRCLRFIFGISRFQHSISYKLAELKWLNMENRRLLHAACFYHKLLNCQSPPYLYNKITYRTDVHHINIRNRLLLQIPRHTSVHYKKCFSYNITRIINSLPNKFRSVSLNTFKIEYKNYLLHRQSV